jgi:hypothetical protein
LTTINIGKYSFRFFIDGSWKAIDIDDFLPCHRRKTPPAENNPHSLIYAKSSKPNILWVPFIEKAYAKGYGSYSAINGGHIREALLDLTGQGESDDVFRLSFTIILSSKAPLVKVSTSQRKTSILN